MATVHVRNTLLLCTFHSLKISTENNSRRRRPLFEVLTSKNVVCMSNYNVINSYLPFSFFPFSMTMLLQLGVYLYKMFREMRVL